MDKLKEYQKFPNKNASMSIQSEMLPKSRIHQQNVNNIFTNATIMGAKRRVTTQQRNQMTGSDLTDDCSQDSMMLTPISDLQHIIDKNI